MKTLNIRKNICPFLLMSLLLSSCSSLAKFSSPEKTAVTYPTQVSSMDGMVQILVPEGEFLVGSTDEEVNELVEICMGKGISQTDCDVWGKNEKPQHTLWLDAFWIDRTEVTNSEYAQCEASGSCENPYLIGSATRNNYYGNELYANYPMVNVTWEMAKAYCEWAGRRLPKEAEWEKAARGSSGRTFPWGEGIDCTKANYAGKDGTDYCMGDTTEVGSYPSGVSEYGVVDMAGNVWEWVGDWYGDSGFPSIIYPMRGGSWENTEEAVRSALRNGSMPFYQISTVGFRCALSK